MNIFENLSIKQVMVVNMQSMNNIQNQKTILTQNSSYTQTNRSCRRSTHRDWYCFCNILIIRIKELGQYSFHIQALLFIYSADFSFICSRKTCNVSVSFNASISSSLISPSPSSMTYTSTSFLPHSF